MTSLSRLASAITDTVKNAVASGAQWPRHSRAILIFVVTISLLALLVFSQRSRWQAPPLRIGVVLARTGAQAGAEQILLDAMTLAVEQLNAQGGVLGRNVQIVIADTGNTPEQATAAANHLLTGAGVEALFGCSEAECRRAVGASAARHQRLLFYPGADEGLNHGASVIYLGAAPNQRIVPGLLWALENFGLQVLLLGTDSRLTRATHALLRAQVEAAGGRVLAEHSYPAGHGDFGAVSAEIAELKPDIVLSTVHGASNPALFRELQATGLSQQALLSFALDTDALLPLPGVPLQAHYVSTSYVQALTGPGNQALVQAWQQRYGAGRQLSEAAAAAYLGVRLWARAVHSAGSSAPELVEPALLRLALLTPSGLLAVDRRSRHLWHYVHIAKVGANAQLELIYRSDRPLRPRLWPVAGTASAPPSPAAAAASFAR